MTPDELALQQFWHGVERAVDARIVAAAKSGTALRVRKESVLAAAPGARNSLVQRVREWRRLRCCCHELACCKKQCDLQPQQRHGS